jgi:hypothetical protein
MITSVKFTAAITFLVDSFWFFNKYKLELIRKRGQKTKNKRITKKKRRKNKSKNKVETPSAKMTILSINQQAVARTASM